MLLVYFLVGSSLLLYLISRFLLGNKLSISFCGRFGMAVMLAVTGIAHFVSPGFMVEMMPDFFPMKLEIVYFTGALELLAAVGLLIDSISKLTAIMAVIFFLCILPANTNGAMKHVQFGGMQDGLSHLWFRIPLQILFIAWTYYFGVWINKTVAPPSRRQS
jgi:uncharacterized membrane protein